MKGRRIEGSTAVVTGANRGIGRAITEALLERGAGRVYAAARDTAGLGDLVERFGDRVVPVTLDVTDAQQVRAVAQLAGDTSLLINNAGVALGGALEDPALVSNARREMEVNYFAPIALLQGLLPALVRNRGALVNVSSIAGLTNFPMFVTYSASKAAVHSLTQAARALLSPRGVSVLGVYPGPVDTDMARGIPFDKASTASVARAVLDGIESGAEEIYPDPFSEQFGRQFETSPKSAERQVAAMAAEV